MSNLKHIFLAIVQTLTDDDLALLRSIAADESTRRGVEAEPVTWELDAICPDLHDRMNSEPPESAPVTTGLDPIDF